MKIDWHKLADQALKIAGPIALAAVAHKVATGRFDTKAIARDASEQTAAVLAAVLRSAQGSAS